MYVLKVQENQVLQGFTNGIRLGLVHCHCSVPLAMPRIRRLSAKTKLDGVMETPGLVRVILGKRTSNVPKTINSALGFLEKINI